MMNAQSIKLLYRHLGNNSYDRERREMKYRIPKGDIEQDKRYRIEEVEGEPFTIPRWEDIEFFKRVEDGAIIISEVSTGRQCGDTYISDEEARQIIKDKFDKKAHKLIKELLKKYQLP